MNRLRDPQQRNLYALVVLAGVCSLGMLWLQTWNVHLNDYGFEAAPAYAALRGGHILSFLRLLPLYGGSLELRAPFAMLPLLWGGGAESVFRLSALPCVAATGIFGVWLARRSRSLDFGWPTAVFTLLLCVANPISERAIAYGHPEELLGAVLCVSAVLAASSERPLWAGLALGLAIANKEWGLLAIGPVLLALRHGRLRCLFVAAMVAGGLDAPLVFVSGAVLSTPGARSAFANTGADFRPQQLWWFIGARGHWVPAMGHQILRDFRLSPGWLNGFIHPAIIWISAPLTLLCARRERRADDALVLLMLLLLVRFAFDPWDSIYYPLPFLFALLTWEVETRARPLLTLAATTLVWLVFKTLPPHLSGDGQALAFLLAFTGPLLLIVHHLYRSALPVKPIKAQRQPRAATTS